MFRKQKSKIKYFFQVFLLVSISLLFVSPALANQITISSVLKLINQDRAKNGQLALEKNDKLTKVAQDKLNDMIAHHYFAHTSPSGISPWHWYKKNKYDYQYAGENLAINFLTVEKQNKAWMASPEHQKNILSEHYLQTGIAIGAGIVNGQMSIITVEEFGALFGAKPTISNQVVFSVNQKANLLNQKNKAIPQVLAVKDKMPNNLKINNNSYLKNSKSLSLETRVKEKISQHKIAIFNFISGLFMSIFSISIILLPLVFLSVATEKIIVMNQENKQRQSLKEV